jgi:hypothetical protein
MHAVGIALFLFAASANLPTQQAVLAPPPVIAPDPAPPHPLTPRDPEARFDTAGLARVIASLAKGVLRDHGH